LAEKKKVRKVNREGQRWTDDRAGMTLRLPLELREAVTEEARVKGDLARVVLFALSHVDRKDVEIQQTRKAGLPLCSPHCFTLEPRLGPLSGNGLKRRV